MNKLFNFGVTLFFLIFYSCTPDGTIETRESNQGCLYISNRLFIPENSVDTTYFDENYINNLFAEKPDLKQLYEKKGSYIVHSKPVFIINNDRHKIIQFTVIITIEDSSKTTRVQIIKLNPGEEVNIGCNKQLLSNGTVVNQSFKIVGAVTIK